MKLYATIVLTKNEKGVIKEWGMRKGVRNSKSIEAQQIRTWATNSVFS